MGTLGKWILGTLVAIISGAVIYWLILGSDDHPSPQESGYYRGAGEDSTKGLVTASRIFAGPKQYPPTEFAAYGILAFRSRSSPYDRDRHLMFCNEYIATLPHASELPIPRAEQMVTVWPINSDDYSNRLNQLLNPIKEICEIAVDNYGLVIAQQALKDAELAGMDMTGTGPFLLAWSPSAGRQ